MDKNLVWVVDDDRDYCELIQETLNDDHDVAVFYDAAQYREALKERTPDLILMDINLPDVSGIELCRQLSDAGKDCAVIFVSGMNTLEERLRAYEVSAVDFIAKPFALKELQAKVLAVAQYQSNKRTLKQSESMSRNMAFQSMTESSQYGAVLQFFRQCFLCHDYPSLAAAFFDLMQQLNMKACLEIRDDQVHYFAPDNEVISPIETKIMELLDKHGRLYDFGNRTICNDKHVSFLIKNMPTDDEVLYGRWRDLIAVIVEGLEARIQDILRQQTLEHVFIEIQALLKGVNGAIIEHDEKFSAALSRMTGEIRSSFHILDLTEEQEEYFASLVTRNLKEADTASEAFVRLQGSINKVKRVVEASGA